MKPWGGEAMTGKSQPMPSITRGTTVTCATFCWCQGGWGGEGEGGGLETVAMRTPAAARTTAKPWVGGRAMTVCGDAHAGGGEDNGEAGEIRRGLGGGLTRGATSRGEIRQWVIIERS